MRSSRIIAYIFLIITVFWCFVIWSFSAKDAELSTVQSNKVLQAVTQVSERVTDKNVDLSVSFIRKSAHVIEFAVLGFLVYITFYLFKIKNYLMMFVISVISFIAVSLIDETMQLFFDGRSMQFSDILLDISGALSVFLICMLITLFLKRKAKQEDI